MSTRQREGVRYSGNLSFLSIVSLLQLVGFGLFFAWIVTSLALPAILFPGFRWVAASIATCLAICFFFLLDWLLPKATCRDGALFVARSVVFTAAGVAGSVLLWFVDAGGVFLGLYGLLVGCAIYSLYACWLNVLKTNPSGSVRSLLALAVAVGFFALLFAFCLKTLAYKALVPLLPAVSYGCYWFSNRILKESERSAPGSGMAPCRHRTPLSARLSTAVAGMILGLDICWLSFFSITEAELACYFGIAALLAVLTFVDLNRWKILKERHFLYITIVMIACTFAQPFAMGVSSVHFATVASLVLSTLCIIQSLGALLETIIVKRLSPQPVFGFSHISRYAGIAAGIALGAVISYGGYQSSWLLSGALLLVLLTVPSLRESHYPTDEMADKGEILYSLEKGGSPDDSAAIDAFADRGGLTAREKEVLRYLIKGRSAGFIAEDLHISAHTAKAHTYSIYQKLDVHSKQDLITLFEETR